MYIIVKIDNILNDLPDYIVRQIVFCREIDIYQNTKKFCFS